MARSQKHKVQPYWTRQAVIMCGQKDLGWRIVRYLECSDEHTASIVELSHVLGVKPLGVANAARRLDKVLEIYTSYDDHHENRVRLVAGKSMEHCEREPNRYRSMAERLYAAGVRL